MQSYRSICILAVMGFLSSEFCLSQVQVPRQHPVVGGQTPPSTATQVAKNPPFTSEPTERDLSWLYDLSKKQKAKTKSLWKKTLLTKVITTLSVVTATAAVVLGGVVLYQKQQAYRLEKKNEAGRKANLNYFSEEFGEHFADKFPQQMNDIRGYCQGGGSLSLAIAAVNAILEEIGNNNKYSRNRDMMEFRLHEFQLFCPKNG